MHEINEKMREFSKGQKKIGNYVLTHYEKAAFLTAAKLGEAVGVSESTVVRFATELGYSGYPQLQHALQEMIRNKLTTVQRIEIANNHIHSTDVLSKILTMDIEKIHRTLEDTSPVEFEEVTDLVVGAEKIFVLGVRSSSALAEFLCYYLYKIFDNVRNIKNTSSSEVFERIMNINEKDVFIAITFPRYSTRTIKAAKYAHDNGATVIAITDSHTAPIIRYADHVLLAKSDMASFADSLVAPLSLINALIVSIGLKKKKEVSEAFEKLERIWDEYEVYEKSEEDAGI